MSEKERKRLEIAKRVDTEDILTVPNLLSVLRIAMIPVIIYLFARDEYWWAGAVLVLSGVTDVVDGWIARRYHVVSNFGKALDPIADKLTQIVVLLCLLPSRFWWVVGILMSKEICIGVLSILTIHRTQKVYGAGWYGKLCTVFIYLSMFTLILWRSPPEWFVTLDMIICAALILLAFLMYCIRYSRILKEAREENTRFDA